MHLLSFFKSPLVPPASGRKVIDIFIYGYIFLKGHMDFLKQLVRLDPVLLQMEFVDVILATSPSSVQLCVLGNSQKLNALYKRLLANFLMLLRLNSKNTFSYILPEAYLTLFHFSGPFKHPKVILDWIFDLPNLSCFEDQKCLEDQYQKYCRRINRLNNTNNFTHLDLIQTMHAIEWYIRLEET